MKVKLICLGMMFFVMHGAFATNNSTENNQFAKAFDQILAKLNDDIYVTSERGGQPEKYQRQMDDAAQKVKSLLSNSTVTASTLQAYRQVDPSGNGLLHMAAFFGYYPLVKVLLEDEHAQAELEVENKAGLTPLDLSRSAFKNYFVFGYPDRLCSPFGYVPLMVNSISFYQGQLKPYQKTTELLMAQGATSEHSIVENYNHFLESRIEMVRDPKYPESIRNALTKQLQANIKQIESIRVEDDEAILKQLSQIQWSIVNAQDTDEIFEHIKIEQLEEMCDEFY